MKRSATGSKCQAARTRPSNPGFRFAPSRLRTSSVQPELAVDRADFGRLDQPRMRNRHRMQRALELLQPEIEEFVQHRKIRAEIVVLPDISLKQPRDDPAADKECWRWSIRSLRAGAGSLLKTTLLSRTLRSPSCPPIPGIGKCFETRTSLQASKLNKLFIFKALAASSHRANSPARGDLTRISTELVGTGFLGGNRNILRQRAWNRPAR